MSDLITANKTFEIYIESGLVTGITLDDTTLSYAYIINGIFDDMHINVEYSHNTDEYATSDLHTLALSRALTRVASFADNQLKFRLKYDEIHIYSNELYDVLSDRLLNDWLIIDNVIDSGHPDIDKELWDLLLRINDQFKDKRIKFKNDYSYKLSFTKLVRDLALDACNYYSGHIRDNFTYAPFK